MTDSQLFLSIGIPSFLIVLSWISNNVRFNGIDKRIDAVERRLDGHEKRFDELQSANHKDALEIMRSMTAFMSA